MKRKFDIEKSHVPENSSMARTLREMDNLGKQMENQRTNKQIKNRAKKVPDPIQYIPKKNKE